METQPMYLCRRVPGKSDLYETQYDWQVFEATPEILERVLVETQNAEKRHKPSDDAALMSLSAGCELSGSGCSWYRVHKPILFAPRPSRCDITRLLLENVMYDAKTTHVLGQWAIMSEHAWKIYGCGNLGTGFGQMYLRNEAGEFYLSKGGISAPVPHKVA